jgi:O-methyltransferase
MIFYSTSKYLKYLRNLAKYSPIYNKYSEFTMISHKEYVECLELVSHFKNLNGSIIECGVWRGGMIAGMVDIMGKERNYWLFDSFEGLPRAKEIDGKAALEWQNNVNSPWYFNNCTAETEWAVKAMKLARAKNYKLIKGWFEDTLPYFKDKEPIAVLHLDADWYDSTITCLEYLFPKVQKGGLIILDDYYVWDGCSKALHDYLSEYKREEKIANAYSVKSQFTGCYLIKR